MGYIGVVVISYYSIGGPKIPKSGSVKEAYWT
jgi:hypothetical protein